METESDTIEERNLNFDEEIKEIDNTTGSNANEGIVIIPTVDLSYKESDNMEEDIVQTETMNPPVQNDNDIQGIDQNMQDVELRRSQRARRHAFPDYYVYMQESKNDIFGKEDPVNFKQVITSEDNEKWLAAMKSELDSMRKNDVWELQNLPQGSKPIGCKWVYKTKRDSKGAIDRYKARLVAKGYTQQDGIDYTETFSLHFEMIDLGEASYVLGIEISRDRKIGYLGLSQKRYIEKILKSFNMMDCVGGDVPINKGDKLSREQAPKTNQEKLKMVDKPYASLVGSLMYAQVYTRLDIAFPISVLGRFQSNPGQAHWVAGKKVMRYLQRTKDFKLIYKRSDNLEMVGYADANFSGCMDDLKSTSGFIFLFGGAAVSWRSVKQPIITTSTMQAEFIACYEATCEAI
ncbi:unnamed protein product [Prunus armeniaca]